jgi:diketogulonate reductase-like aldo/keto reductase
MPYDADAPLAEQVKSSIASSLRNLAPSGAAEEEAYLDSVVLHSPLESIEDTIVVWKTLSKYVPDRIRHLGISNTPLEIVKYLLEAPDIRTKPSVVQNRFHGQTGYESELRALCRQHGIVFQSFWTLSGNPRLLKNKIVGTVADSAGVKKEVAYYSLVLGLEGITILDGTTSQSHMKTDLGGIEAVGRWAEDEGKDVWTRSLQEFRALVGDV